MTYFEGCKTPPSIHLSIHPGVTLVVILTRTEMLFLYCTLYSMYNVTYICTNIHTPTHTHTLYRMLTRSTSVKINQTVPLLSHNMMKLHQVCSCQAKKAWTSTTVVTYHHMREEIQKTLTLFTSGSHSALRRSRGIYYQFQEDLCLHFYNGCFEVYLFFKLKE